MATDIVAILANLEAFFTFRDKTVIHVGAGGGQFIRYAEAARHVIAVDPDAGAVASLRSAVAAAGLDARFTIVQAAFESLSRRADVVFFEFCLHEIEDPASALAHARSLAPDTIVIDHGPDSRWAWYAAEEEKAAGSWAAVERAGVRRQQACSAWQHFADREALVQRVEGQGAVAAGRARAWTGPLPVTIEMTYRIALL